MEKKPWITFWAVKWFNFDSTIPSFSSYTTRREARRFKRALKIANTGASKITIQKGIETESGSNMIYKKIHY